MVVCAMKTSKLRGYSIIVLSAWCTFSTCLQAILMRFSKQINRSWVDKALSLWINKLLQLVGVECSVYNPHRTQPIPGKATIIMCNHSSMYDIPLSYKAFPDNSMRMLAKKELSKIPFLGKGMQAAEFPFVDRRNRKQALEDLAYAQQLMESGIIIWIAPEGTRSKDGALGAFKKGAFVTAIQAQATIIPIGIRGASSILPARTMQFNLNQKAEVHIGAAIDAAEYSLDRKDELIKQVHKIIHELISS